MAATRRSGAPPPGLPVQRGGKTVAALLLLAAALFGGALTPGAASAVTLISNVDLDLVGVSNNIKADLSATDLAQAFTTGSNTTGYTLTGIKMKFFTSLGGSLLLPSGTDTVTMIVTDGLSSTATTVATLTNPGTWTATSEFMAPSGTTLAANTTYYVIVEASGGSMAATNSGNEDAGAEAGWSIANSLSIRSQSTSGLGGSWTGSPRNVLQIAVEGTVNAPPPSVSRLEVTSIPGDNATYGIGLPVEVTVHFSSNVDIAVAPQLELDFDGSAKTAECSTNIHKDERTATTTCIYIVMVDDVDADGIAIGANKLTLPSGTITAMGSTTVHAVLDHAAVAAQSGHKVDGIRPTLSTTGAAAPRTSTDGTQVILTFSEPLATASIPAERFTVTADDVAVPLTPPGAVPSGTTVTLTLETALTSAQTVTVTYTDPPIVDGSDVIQDVTGNAAASFTNVAVVNNAPDPVFGVTTVRIASAAGSDDTYAINNTVAVQVFFSAPIAVTGTPQLELDFDGAPKPADCRRVPIDTGQLWCTVDVAENDVDADGIAIKANALTLPNGATITAVGSTTDHAVLDHAAVAAQSAHTVDGVRPTLVSAATSAAGTKIRLRFSEVLRGAAVANITVTINGSPVTPGTAGFFAGSRGIEFNLNPAVAAGDRVTVAIPAATVSDQAGNGNPAQAATPVTNSVPPPMVTPMVGALISNLGQISIQDLTFSEVAVAQPFTTGTHVAGYTLTGISLQFNTTPTGTDTGTVRVMDGLESTATLVATMTNPGTWAATSAFTAPSGTTLDPGTTYYVIVDIPGRGRASGVGMAVDSAAAGWSLGTLNVRASTTWMSLAGRRLQVAVQGQAIPIPAITAVALTSNPGRDSTYAIDDVVKATVTFSEAVDVAGAPQLELDFNGTMKTAACEPETNTTELSCAYDVVAGDVDADGIALHANRLTLPTDSDTIRATGSTTVNAVLAHAGLATNANHTVDGIRPTLVSAETSTDGTKVILTFSENIGHFSNSDFRLSDARHQLARPSISGHVVTVTLAVFHFIRYGDTITLEVLTGVEDTAGNQTATIRNRAITNTIPRPPGVITGVAITSDPGMDGIYLTDDVIEITVTYDEAVAVAVTGGTPQIRFRLNSSGSSADRWAEYARGSGSTQLVFSYTVKSTDESSFHGIHVGPVSSPKIALRGGTITLDEPGGVEADLNYTSLGSNPGHLVNWARPTLVSAETSIDGTQIILTFSEVLGLAGDLVLPVTLFGVTVDGTAVTLSGNASGRGTVLTLELATALTSRTQSVLVSYTARDSVSFPDRAGNPVVEFTNQPVTNTVVPPPTITSVAIVNQPADNTYAIGDSVTASVTFSEAVTVTGNPELALDVGGTPQAAGCLPLTNVVSMLCLYIVMVDDVDADGIAIPANAFTLSDGDTIMATATTRHADLTHDAVPADAGATVEAIRPTLVTTGAAAPHTSTDGTKVLLAFDEPLDPAGTGGTWAVEVAGSAVTATAAVAGSRVTLTLATALTAASQVVTVSYTDPNPGNPNDSTVLQDVQGNDAASFTSPVTNRFGSNPRITGVALTSDPGADETYAIGESVEATVTFSDPVDVTGTPQLQVRLTDAGGGATPKNAGCAAATNTVTMVCAYEVEVGVDGEGGIAIATNSVSLNSGTIRATGSTTVNAGLTHDAVVTVQAGHRVDGIRPTLSTAETSRDGTQVLLTFSEEIQTVRASAITVTVDGTAATLSTGAVTIIDAVLTIALQPADVVEAGETVTVALAVAAVTDVAGNGNAVLAATAVANTVPAAPGAPRNLSTHTTSTTTPGSIRLSFGAAVGADRHEFRARPTGGSWEAWTPVTQEVTPGSVTHNFAAGLTPGTAYTLEVQGVNLVGAGPASNQATGIAAAAVEIAGVALTSDPGPDQTYGIGEEVFATLTFSRPVTIPTDVPARPRLEFDFNGTGKPAACPAVTQANVVTCFYQVAEGDTAPTGIAIRANALTPNGARFQLGSGSAANTTYAVPLAHRALAAQAGHKVDGVRPTLTSAETSPDGTQVLLTFSEEIHAVTASAITVTVGGTAATLSGGTVSFTGAVLTFPLQPADVVEAGETVTVALAADAVTDVAGNGNAVLAATAVTNQVGVAWTFTLTDADGTAVTELIEDGASATATVTITNPNVRFDTEQTITLRWGVNDIGPGSLIQGAGGATTITIPAQGTSGSLEISVSQNVEVYYLPLTIALTATHGGTGIGSIDLTRVDAQDPPVASITQAPTAVTEGGNIEIELALSVGYASPGSVRFTVTDGGGALSGTLPDGALFFAAEKTRTITLTTDDNSVQNDGAREVTVTLGLSPNLPYTLGTTSSVTVEVRDNDTPPTAPRNLTAQAGDTTARLTWQAPETDHGQPFTYEYRYAASGAALPATWTAVPQSDADTTEFTVTGLTHGTAYTVEVAAVNVAGRGAAASVTTTTLVLPTIDRLEFTSDPGIDNTYAINGKVQVTVHFSSQVDITAAPQLELDFDGVPKTAGCITDEMATATTTCTYIVAEGDVASAGIAIQANKLTGGTITATGSPTVNADLTYAALAADANHKVDGIRPTLTSAETSSDGTQVLLTFSEPLAAVPGNSLGPDAWTVEVDGAAVTVTASGSGISGTTVTLGLGTALTASTQMVTVSYAGPGGGFGGVEDAAGNSADSFTDQAVANTVPAAPEVTITAGDAVTEGAAAVFTLTRTGATTAALAVTVTVAEDGAMVAPADEGAQTVTFAIGDGTATLNVATVNDAVAEAASTVTAALGTGTGYRVGTPGSASLTVSDNDAPPPVVSTDATLSALTLSPGTLSPAFLPAVTLYGATVEPRVAQITVTLTPAAGAMVAYTDGAGAVLTDVDGLTAGLQVALDEGANTITITVTAEDGMTMQTYTVTVTREAATAPGQPTGLTVGTVTTNSIMLSWTAPANDGGADLAHYRIEWSADGSTNWTLAGTTADGATTTFTHTGRTAGTPYHYRVRAHNGRDGAWSATVSATTTAAVPSAPTIDRLEFTSDPGSLNTYGINGRVEVTVHFSSQVDITGAPQLELDFDGVPKTAGCVTDEMATATTTCTYIVAEGDVASAGIAIQANKLTGGTITATGSPTVNADLTYAALAADANHTVDGIRPTLITTGTDAPTTSTDGDLVILTFSKDISAIDGSKIKPYVSGTTLVSHFNPTFSGKVVTLDPGGTILATSPPITVVLDADAVADAVGNGNLAVAATTVINAFTTAPTVNSIAFNSAGADGAYKVGDAVEATVTFSEAVTVDTMDGTPQLTIDVGGTDKVLDYSSGSGAAALVFSGYTVAANDEDTDGISIAANKLDANSGTIKATADATLGAVLTHAAVADSASHKVDGVKPTVASAEATEDSLTIKFSEALDENSTPATSAFTLNVDSGTAPTISSVAIAGRNVTLSLSAAVDTSKTYTIDYTAPMTSPLQDEASNPAAAFSDHPVTNEVPATAPDAPTGLEVTPGDGSVTLRWTASAYDGGSEVTGHQYRQKTTGGFGSWQDIELSAPGEANATSYPVTSLMNDTAYTFEVQARNEEGESGPSNQASATPVAGDTTAPMLRSATTTALEVGLTYDENLDGGSEPAPSAFTVAVDGVSRAVTGVSVGAKVLLTLASAVRAGETVTVSYTVPMTSPLRDEARNPAAAFSDHPVTNATPATAPEAPTGLEATPGDGSVTLRWTASAYDGGSEVTSHQYRHKTTGGFGSWEDIELSAPGEANATSYPVTSLMNDTAYTFEVQARNAEGDSGPSNQASATLVAGDSTAPMLRSATTTALEVGLTYDEALDADSEPAPSAFSVTVDGASRAVTGVALDETKVFLTLAPAVRAGETVTVSYTVPAMNPLRDEANNPAASFADHPVTNETLATAPEAPTGLAATPGDGSVTLRWTASAYDGGRAVTGHQYCREEGPSASCTAESDWQDIADSAPGGANATGYTVSDLTNGTGYTFRVRARNAEGASAPSPAAGTTPDASDTASSELVRALSAGFGRMVGSQALSMVSAHLEGGGGTQVTVGGERLGGPAEAALARLEAAARDGDEGRTRAGREVLHGSSFRLQSGGKETGAAAWGRIAAGRFETRSDGVATGGEVTTGMVGADVTSGRWLVGGALSHARGKGSFATSAERAEGEAEVRLTTVHPYARVRLGERMSAWGLAGYGKGELALSATGGERVATGLRMWMGAVGARGTLVPAPAGGGFELALKTDALWMRVISEAAEGLPGARADARRLRLVLDASRVVETAGGATLTPRFEVGVRRDGGDTQRGAGLEVGAGLRYARSAVTVEGRVRALALHEASGYEEWGASGSVRVDPSASGRGLSLTLAPTWGDAASAVERLWSLRDAGGLAANADFEPRARLDAELGYGLRGPRGVGVATPYAGLGLAREGARAWRAGARWKLAPDFTLGLEATRREPSTNAPPEHRLMLRGALRW